MKLRPFELTLVVVFGLMMVLSLILLRMYQPEPEVGEVRLGGPVSIWGTLPAEGVNEVLKTLAVTQEAYKQVTYRYIPPERFDSAFINALADGSAPDLVLIPHESIVKHRTRLEVLPYENFPERDFRNIYVDGAEIFALSNGIIAYPIAVDPLMLYWNRNLLAQENFINAPTTWEDLVTNSVPALTKRTPDRTLTQAAVALGEYSNVRNAFAIISLLAIQGGSALVTEAGNFYEVKLDETQGGAAAGRPLTTAITFYTNFNTVANTLYSWDRSQPLDREQFLAERLALYFGFGSEARELKERNPNLNFDIAQVPQGQTATVRRTYGIFYGLAVPRLARNKTGAYLVRQDLTGAANAKLIVEANNLAPVHRSLLAAGSNDMYGRIIYEAVPSARGWLNPDRARTDELFTQMLDDIRANRTTIPSAVRDTIIRLEQVYR